MNEYNETIKELEAVKEILTKKVKTQQVEEKSKNEDPDTILEHIVNTNSDMRMTKELHENFMKPQQVEEKSIEAPPVKKRIKPIQIAAGFAAGALLTVLVISGIFLSKDKNKKDSKQTVKETTSTVQNDSEQAAKEIINYNEMNYDQKVKVAISIAKTAAEEKLLEAGLATLGEDGKIIIEDNSISDYAKLNLSDPSPAVIRAYDEAISNPEEFDKLIKSTSYENEAYNYIGTTQYYTVNGYYDPETGKGSRDVYITYTNNDLVEALNQDQIDNLINGETNQTQRRGH